MSAARAIAARLVFIGGMAACVFSLTLLFNDQSSRGAGSKVTPAAPHIAAMAESWTGEIDYGPLYSALSPTSSDAAIMSVSAFDPSDDYWGLPRTSGVEAVAAYCGSCHSLALVMQQRQTADGWSGLLDWMVEKQGMAEPESGARAEIVAYLAREFGSE